MILSMTPHDYLTTLKELFFVPNRTSPLENQLTFGWHFWYIFDDHILGDVFVQRMCLRISAGRTVSTKKKKKIAIKPKI